ncbi:hypothetical protein [Gloeobacter kilaueensis]|uniref:Uncharacterized protein n=1 Tax=Gloeobacter kilaueensis (strain ATCC BAA-2537 / CCAP 1431/1 / ULC 316 / JS1) TaxID=1183438 RepID=U5QJU3_GLOK1|nr:hypothetical protein [Gloeobacter kilaueensis]AGY57925.1 hypothetical protein GKIL_1679 [Gloeobacter kilaueensis JS1]
MANFYDIKHYIAHHVNKGRRLMGEKGESVVFCGRVYDGRGNYSEAFNDFIEKLLSSGHFFRYYIEEDGFAFAELSHAKFEMDYCVTCREPIPVPVVGALGPPACYLCPVASECDTSTAAPSPP